jgi:dockerin type I repeat protein
MEMSGMKKLSLLIVLALCTICSLIRAASSHGCEGGGFVLLGLAGNQDTVVPATSVPSTFLVKGLYVEFTVDAATFGVRDWTLTGAPSELDITGGRRTVVFASKMPDHRGVTLNSGVSVKMNGGSLVISRDGPGVSMKIQVKDCANGGLFQMEVERDDQAETLFTHILADGVFYFDNPNVRDRLGERIPCSGVLPDGTPVVCNGANVDGTVTVTARVNFANDFSNKFVGRDSPQVATRIVHDCVNNIPNPFHPGTVNHCGGISQWSVASGGRMGQVMGEDATEIAPAATPCTEDCTAQNQVNGRALVVGFPFPVPAAVRLQPRFDAPAPLQLSGAVSRKTHGASGTFDVNLPLVGEPGVECRANTGGDTLVFTFNNNVVSGTGTVTSGTGSVSGSPVFAGNTMTLNLAGVSDAQKISVTLSNVTDSFGQVLPNRVVNMNVLVGDINGSNTVNATDVAQIKAESGRAITPANFRADLNPNGSINASDVALLKLHSGAGLP